jgi:hypothetical protein
MVRHQLLLSLLAFARPTQHTVAPRGGRAGGPRVVDANAGPWLVFRPYFTRADFGSSICIPIAARG